MAILQNQMMRTAYEPEGPLLSRRSEALVQAIDANAACVSTRAMSTVFLAGGLRLNRGD